MWFTVRPAFIRGVVTTADGQPVRAPWVLTASADRALHQDWASTNDATQANTVGRFSIPVRPGAYVLRALPHAAFDSYQSARRQILPLTAGGTKVSVVNDREVANTRLTLRP